MGAFVVIPAIDVLEGRCVRLSEGRRERVTIEGGEPGQAAARFAAEGAAWLHVVDLDGAFSGRPTPGLVERVASAGVPVQVGGGLRDPDAMQAALDAGAARIIVGTVALSVGTGLSLSHLEEQLVVAVDAKDGRVVTDGWVTQTDVTAKELAERCADDDRSASLAARNQRHSPVITPIDSISRLTYRTYKEILCCFGHRPPVASYTSRSFFACASV